MFKVNYKNSKSWALQARKKRFQFLMDQIHKMEKPIKILDVGGTQGYWELMGYDYDPNIEIYLLNLQEQKGITMKGFKAIVGDATNLCEYKDGYFDLVFSNSVIEHLFNWENQVMMAKEVVRVGKKFFIQTPNYWFPLEPHFLFPCFQYLPERLRVFLASHFNLGHHPKYSLQIAQRKIAEVKLLSIGQMKKLFPDALIYEEKFFGLTKSIIAYNIR